MFPFSPKWSEREKVEENGIEVSQSVLSPRFSLSLSLKAEPVSAVAEKSFKTEKTSIC